MIRRFLFAAAIGLFFSPAQQAAAGPLYDMKPFLNQWQAVIDRGRIPVIRVPALPKRDRGIAPSARIPAKPNFDSSIPPSRRFTGRPPAAARSNPVPAAAAPPPKPTGRALALPAPAVRARQAAGGTMAIERFYVKGSAGLASPRSVDGTVSGVSLTLDYEKGLFISGALGYRAQENVRLEAEVSYAKLGLESVSGNGVAVDLSGDWDLVSFTASGFFDINTNTSVTPYIGGGAGLIYWDRGVVTASLNGTSVTIAGDDGTEVTAFAEAGVSIALDSKFELVPSYRFQWADTGSSGIDDDTIHIFKVGLQVGL